eukprot:3149839-Amphidinium_carterae.1
MSQMLGDPWAFLHSSPSAVDRATEPTTALFHASNPSMDAAEPDLPTVPPDMAELLAPILKQLEELRKAQLSQTKQVIDCLGTIAGALEQITRQQTLLLARAPVTSPAASSDLHLSEAPSWLVLDLGPMYLQQLAYFDACVTLPGKVTVLDRRCPVGSRTCIWVSLGPA